LCGGALAQQYPTKPVKLIVTYPPGGSSDLLARVFGQKLSEIWGQPVLVESKPGAAGSIGMDYAAKQANDGYSFVVGNIGPAAVNPLLSKVPYDVERDFVAGHIQYIFSDSLPAMQFIKAGRARALCVTGSERSPITPELPPCAEAVPGLVAVNWWGVFMPAGTPKAVTEKFHADLVKAIQDAEVKK